MKTLLLFIGENEKFDASQIALIWPEILGTHEYSFDLVLEKMNR